MLVNLSLAKQHLRRDDDEDDERIIRTIESAPAIVLNHLKISLDSYNGTDGSADDVPSAVEAATLLVIENLYDHPEIDPLSEAVRSILLPLRDPAMC